MDSTPCASEAIRWWRRIPEQIRCCPCGFVRSRGISRADGEYPAAVGNQSEARAIAAITHPHICQIYDVEPDYLVLEYLQGEPIGGPVTRDEAVRLASQIADALHAAHERVVRQGGGPHAKLLDFGSAPTVAR